MGVGVVNRQARQVGSVMAPDLIRNQGAAMTTKVGFHRNGGTHGLRPTGWVLKHPIVERVWLTLD